MHPRRYLVALALITMPLIFVWTLEVAFISHEMQTLIFYVIPISGVAAYHTTMYLLFIICWFAAFLILSE